MDWEPVIGLEVHAQLNTESKIFSGASTAYGADPNTQACAIDLGLPGVLPVLNENVVTMAIKFGLAINADIPQTSVFARKNYFYPDLPKGYQISQHDQPTVGKGQLTVQIDTEHSKTIGITRAHLEEDAGKSIHLQDLGMTGIDLNRAGTPLLEIVSEPEIGSAQEAVAYLKTLHALVTYLQICDGNMQEGSFRCDANVSVRPKGESQLGTRTEIKNVNSFKFVEKAINFEIARQIDMLESGGQVIQETRLYDADKNETRAMRSKEEANDYRYFPDPDLLPIEINAQTLEQVKQSLPELPEQKKQRFQTDYQLNAYDASLLVTSRELADYFEQVVKQKVNAKLAANWVIGDLSSMLAKAQISLADSPVSAQSLAQLLSRIEDQTISGKIGKTVFEAMWQGQGDADSIIQQQGLKQMTDSGEIESIIDNIIKDNPQQREQYLAGKEKLFGFFVGQVMKATQGKANPQQVNDLLKKKL